MPASVLLSINVDFSIASTSIQNLHSNVVELRSALLPSAVCVWALNRTNMLNWTPGFTDLRGRVLPYLDERGNGTGNKNILLPSDKMLWFPGMAVTFMFTFLTHDRVCFYSPGF